MKRYKRILCLLGMVFSVHMQGASAQSLPSLERMESVPLYSSEPVQSYSYRVSYPGLMTLMIENGTNIRPANQPDCLVLHTNLPADGDKLARLAHALRVEFGAGILFGGHRKITEMPPQIINGTVVFFMGDLSTYVTGLRVSTRDASKTIPQVVAETLSENSLGVVLTYSGGCLNVVR